MNTPHSLRSDLSGIQKNLVPPQNPDDSFDASAVLDALDRVHSHLITLAESTHQETKLVRQSASEGLPVNLRLSFTKQFATTLSKLEQTLCSYIANCSDPNKIWEYIAASKDHRQEEICLHIQESEILVYLPYLPKRGKGYSSPVNHMLAAKIYSCRTAVRWSKWKAAFYHVHPTATSRIPKDVDNYDYKRTIDLLAFLVGSSDNSLNYSMSMDTILTDKIRQGVYIRLTPKSSGFSEFDPTDLFAFFCDSHD